MATNVVSGTQIIYNVPPGQNQQRTPPLQRPRRVEHFVNRAAEQARLLADLEPGRVVTVCGPGGMGKTALIAEALWTLAPGNTLPATFSDGLYYYNFSSQPRADLALEEIARAFGERPLPTAALAAQRALRGKNALLVLDSAEETDNLRQILDVGVDCAVLVISRRRTDAVDTAYRLELQQLPTDEGVMLLQAWGGKRAVDKAALTQISEVVGGLPLALRLIGRYLDLHEAEADEYLSWLQDAPLSALDQSQESVTKLLEHSVAKLSGEAQQALALIGFLALAPFEREVVVQALDFSSGTAGRALGELVNYGLVMRREDLYEVSHPLIHTYAHVGLLAAYEPARRCILAERIVRILHGMFPNMRYPDSAICERLLPHVQACISLIDQYGLTFKEAAGLLYVAGTYMQERGRYTQAELLIKPASAIYEQVLGSDDPGTAAALNGLAGLHLNQGRYAEAEPFYQRALSIEEKALPPDHPDIATALNNLAVLYLEQGWYTQAEPLIIRALTIEEKTLGLDHPKIAAALTTLAGLYRAQGKYAEAEPLLQRALTIREKALGPGHPDTANALHNLAVLYYFDLGRYAQAEPLLWRALTIKEKMFGPEHPTTAETLDNLAQLYRGLGRHAQAEPLYQRALAGREKVLGPEHPKTAETLDNLGGCYIPRDAQRDVTCSEQG